MSHHRKVYPKSDLELSSQVVTEHCNTSSEFNLSIFQWLIPQLLNRKEDESCYVLEAQGIYG